MGRIVLQGFPASELTSSRRTSHRPGQSVETAEEAAGLLLRDPDLNARLSPDRVFTECPSTCALTAPSTVHAHMAR